MAKKVLFIYNDPVAPEAMLGSAFAECGYDVEVFEVVPAHAADDPDVEATFPDPRGYDAIVPLGSRWGVNDGLAWIDAEAAMIRDAHEAGVPMLGVCFGGQLLAHALGGSVSRSPSPEIGWYGVESTQPKLVCAGPWFQWHFDRFRIPDTAQHVASNGNASQAFVLGRTMGLQFHPELDLELLELWLAGDGRNEIVELGLSADALRRATAQEVDGATARVHALVRAFVDTVAERDA